MASSSAPDALQELRNAVQHKSNITFALNGEPTSTLSSATHIVLSPSLSLPKIAPTRLRKPGMTSADPDANPEDFFPLFAVYLAWQLRDAPGAEYMKGAREAGLAVGFVSVTERQKVVNWLEGKVERLESIVPLAGESTTPPGSPPQRTRNLPGATSTSTATASPTKRKYVVDASDVELVKKIKANEIELRDRNTVLRGVKPNNFSSVRQVYHEKLKKLRETPKPGASAAAAATPQDPKMQARKARNLQPIIMISSSPTALVTMHNVKRFLQDAVFESSQEARARAAAAGNPRPEDVQPIYRRRTTIDTSGRETETQARYLVVDSIEALSKFGPDAWDRVVCVMTTGQAWQFRPYRWTEPKTLFHHVKGIYFTWANDPPNTKIQDWNVTELKIDANRRHVDKAVVAHFWKLLDSWTLANKPWLMKV